MTGTIVTGILSTRGRMAEGVKLGLGPGVDPQTNLGTFQPRTNTLCDRVVGCHPLNVPRNIIVVTVWDRVMASKCRIRTVAIMTTRSSRMYCVGDRASIPVHLPVKICRWDQSGHPFNLRDLILNRPRFAGKVTELFNQRHPPNVGPHLRSPNIKRPQPTNRTSSPNWRPNPRAPKLA